MRFRLNCRGRDEPPDRWMKAEPANLCHYVDKLAGPKCGLALCDVTNDRGGGRRRRWWCVVLGQRLFLSQDPLLRTEEEENIATVSNLPAQCNVHLFNG